MVKNKMSDNKNIDLPYINNHVCPLVCQKSSKDFENRTRFHAEPDSSNSFLIGFQNCKGLLSQPTRISRVYHWFAQVTLGTIVFKALSRFLYSWDQSGWFLSQPVVVFIPLALLGWILWYFPRGLLLDRDWLVIRAGFHAQRASL